MRSVPRAFAKALVAQLRSEADGVRYTHLLRRLRADPRIAEHLQVAHEHMQVLFEAFSPRLHYDATARLVTLLPPPRMDSYSKAIVDGMRDAYQELKVRVYRPNLSGDGCVDLRAQHRSWKLQVATSSEYQDTEVHVMLGASTLPESEWISIHHVHQRTLEEVRNLVDDILSERLVVWWVDWQGLWGGSEMRLPNHEPSPELTTIAETDRLSRIRAWSWEGTYAQ